MQAALRGIRDGLGLEELTLDLERLTDGAPLIAIASANDCCRLTQSSCVACSQPHAAAAQPAALSFANQASVALTCHAATCFSASSLATP